MNLPVKILAPNAYLPTRGTPQAAGLDLYSIETFSLRSGDRRVVRTGIALDLPEDHVGLIWDRSGWAAKRGLTVLAGVIDADYRGEVGVVLLNTSIADFKIQAGERIAQLLVQPIVMVEPIVVTDLAHTERGEGAWGSTG